MYFIYKLRIWDHWFQAAFLEDKLTNLIDPTAHLYHYKDNKIKMYSYGLQISVNILMLPLAEQE